MKTWIALFLCLAGAFCAGAQPLSLQTRPWPAQWIAPKGAPAQDYGVYHFRKTLSLPRKPASFRVYVSADNRYQLYVNGRLASLGPSRSDVAHWKYETVDLAPFLQDGKNVLAAVVWHYGPHAPVAQMSARLGFILQGEDATAAAANTDTSWLATPNPAYSPTFTRLSGYFVVGPGERVDGLTYPWGWEATGYDDSRWTAAEAFAPGLPGGIFQPWYERNWGLLPGNLPAMERTPQRLASLRRSEGVAPPAAFPARPADVTLAPGSRAVWLLDQGFETTAYPVLEVSGGKGARIRISFAETLYEPGGYPERKGNRNEVEGKEFTGYYDEFLPDGGSRRQFVPLWWRTYRYVQVEIETGEAPLTFHDLYGIYTGFPFENKASLEVLESRNPALTADLGQILETGWRTARLCAHETYMDCPYYEQLQYVGDTRIQALVSLYNSGDDRLMRDAIIQIRHSHGLDGITMSRYPTSLAQYIPPFSLWWIAMLHDYHRYRGDRAFIQDMLPVSRAILHFFESRRSQEGYMKVLPYWNFTDWARGDGWLAGRPPITEQGQSAILDLQLLLAYQHARDLEAAAGLGELAAQYDQRILSMQQSVRQWYYDPGKKLFADTPFRREFSQHANALAVITGVVSGEEARTLMQRTLTDTALTQATIYFKFYLHQAAVVAGLGNEYLTLLGEWRNQLALGLTTWAEEPEPTRSDCHAWGASPNIELYRVVLGIDAAAEGFSRVRIQPHLGPIRRVRGAMPHPKGTIQVAYEVDAGGKLKAEITLPAGTPGQIVWNGKTKELQPGRQTVVMP